MNIEGSNLVPPACAVAIKRHGMDVSQKHKEAVLYFADVDFSLDGSHGPLIVRAVYPRCLHLQYRKLSKCLYP